MGMCANHQGLGYEHIGRLQEYVICTRNNSGANSRYLSMRGSLLKRLTLWHGPGVPKADEKQFETVGHLSSRTHPKTWWSGIMMTFVLITFVAPPPVRALLLVYFELVAQAHFTPPSFTSFLDDFNFRIPSSSLTKTLVCPTLHIALIGPQLRRFQLFLPPTPSLFYIKHSFISNRNGTTN